MGKVRVRAVTVGIPGELESSDPLFDGLASFFPAIERDLEGRDFEVQTRRLTLEPAKQNCGWTRFRLVRHLESLSRRAQQIGVRWLCQPIDPAEGWNSEELRLVSIEIARRLPNVFVHYRIATGGSVHTGALEAVARAILDVARSSRNGFDNFRIGAGANPPANGAFLPYSFHDGDPAFSLAVEPTELVLEIVERHSESDTDSLREELVAELALAVAELGEIAERASARAGVPFRGVDLSLAPFPAPRRGVGQIIEKLSHGRVGTPGALTSTALLTGSLKEAVRRAGVPAIGFCGVMFSPLEDAHLAAALGARQCGISDLLLWSAVCGCGLDMVPVPGAILVEQLVGLMLDVSTLSCSLKKPLGVRLLPIPGKDVNDLTDFNHDFLVNTRVQGVSVEGPDLHRLRTGSPIV